METMKLFGGEFEQYVPYIMNEELLASLELYAVKDDDKSARVKVVARDIISKIPNNIIPSIVEDGTFEATIIYGEQTLKIDTLKCLPSFRMFSTFLDLLKKVGSSRKALSCVWYYYPDDCYIKDDASSG